MPKELLHGVIAAVPTPFSSALDIDGDAFIEHCQWCLNQGCDALNVLGTTGEANSLSFAQRSYVMTVAAERLERKRLMVGTGTPDLATTVSLTSLAFELGYAAALVLPPYYYKPVSEEGIFIWFSQLVAQTERTPIDLYLYNFPQLTGIEFSPSLAERLHVVFGERIKGIKDSSGNLDYARRLARLTGFAVFPSNEVSLAHATEDRFAGCISATINVTPAMSAALWRDQHDLKLQDGIRSLRQQISSHPLVAAVKWLVEKRTGNPIWKNVAPPNLPISGPDALTQLDSVAQQLTMSA